MKEKKYLTSAEAAKYLGITKSTLFNWEKKGLIKVYRNTINNYRMYKIEDLDKILK